MSCFARPLILVNVQRSLPFFSNGGGGWSERKVFQLRRRLCLPKQAFSCSRFYVKQKELQSSFRTTTLLLYAHRSRKMIGISNIHASNN
uniref:Uncharacterized protein n=1 Tax=Enterococcus faecium TaxID=1352 RepID=E3USR5_ENTFC|nr:hypothetical protein pLG1-0012 [Enterococcus faecium]